MEVVSKSRQFESLRERLVMLRSNTTKVAEESEDNLTPKTPKENTFINDDDPEVAKSKKDDQTDESEIPSGSGSQHPHHNISGQAIKSGIVRIWQSWRSSDKTDGPSFTHKRGVSVIRFFKVPSMQN